MVFFKFTIVLLMAKDDAVRMYPFILYELRVFFCGLASRTGQIPDRYFFEIRPKQRTFSAFVSVLLFGY